jgi:hypothetical protein
MGYGRMATHRPGGVLPGGHSPSHSHLDFQLSQKAILVQINKALLRSVWSFLVLKIRSEFGTTPPPFFVTTSGYWR